MKNEELLIAALDYLRNELNLCYWNKNQEQIIDPFGNTGGYYINDTFEVIAYRWDDESQDYNFKWKDVKITWYKYLGRGMECNIELSPDDINELLMNCLNSLQKNFPDTYEDN